MDPELRCNNSLGWPLPDYMFLDFPTLTDDLFSTSGTASTADGSTTLDLGQCTQSEHARPQNKTVQPCSVDEAWVSKLAEINVKLFKHAATIPRAQKDSANNEEQSDFDSSPNQPQVEDGGGSSFEGTRFAIDETFQLSRQLIDILNEIYPKSRLSSQNPVKGDMEDPAPTNYRYGMNNRDAACNEVAQNCPAISAPSDILLDPGSNILVLSCYLRILDIYAKLFGKIDASISNKDFLRSIRLPRLTVGTFSLHPTSALQITLIMQLAEELLDRLRDVVALTNQTASPRWPKDNEQDWHSSALSGVAEVTLQAIRFREAKIIKGMKGVRLELQRSGIT